MVWLTCQFVDNILHCDIDRFVCRHLQNFLHIVMGLQNNIFEPLTVVYWMLTARTALHLHFANTAHLQPALQALVLDGVAAVGQQDDPGEQTVILIAYIQINKYQEQAYLQMMKLLFEKFAFQILETICLKILLIK